MKRFIPVFAVAAALLSSCASGPVTMEQKFPKIWADGFNLEAHRGFSDEYPENTEASFRAAAEVGRPHYQGMESDVQMTADSVIVMIHDDKVDRTTDGTGAVKDYRYEDLILLDAGNGEKVPTFECYLDYCRKAGFIPYVELKTDDRAAILRTFAILADKGWKDGDYVVTSFKLDALAFAATLCDTPMEFMAGRFKPEKIDEVMAAIPNNLVIRPKAANITQELVDLCAERGLPMEAYGLPVGDKPLLDSLKAWGVKGVTCNSWKGLE